MDFNKNNYNNYVPIWLLTMILLVFFMIVVGGLTRLTDSGLSITKWELFKGIIPPLTKIIGLITLVYTKNFLNLSSFIQQCL